MTTLAFKTTFKKSYHKKCNIPNHFLYIKKIFHRFSDNYMCTQLCRQFITSPRFSFLLISNFMSKENFFLASKSSEIAGVKAKGEKMYFNNFFFLKRYSNQNFRTHLFLWMNSELWFSIFLFASSAFEIQEWIMLRHFVSWMQGSQPV